MPYMEHLRDLNLIHFDDQDNRLPSSNGSSNNSDERKRIGRRPCDMRSTPATWLSDNGCLTRVVNSKTLQSNYRIKPIFLAEVARIRMMSVRVTEDYPKKITVENKSNY